MAKRDLDIYLSDVGRYLITNCANDAQRAKAEPFWGTVLLIDISGFTELVRESSRSGAIGTENLSDVLKSYFSVLTSIVTQAGGDIVSFAGDALLATWLTPDPTHSNFGVLRAAQAASAVKREIAKRDLLIKAGIRHRSSISAGTFCAMLVGGERNKWEFLLVGDPILEASKACIEGRMDDVTIAKDTWPFLAEYCEGEQLKSGRWRLRDFRVTAPAPSKAEPIVDLSCEKTLAELSPYVPTFVSSRVNAGYSEWLPEFRNVTALFAGLDFSQFDHERPLQEVQIAVATIQDAIFRHGGTVYQCLMEGNFIVLVGMFGLPFSTHEDDPTRGILAARVTHRNLKAKGFRVSVGISSGLAFCGTCGTSMRSQYIALGAVMNLAARLMQAEGNGVLCDGAMRALAPNNFDGGSPVYSRIGLKGFGPAVEVIEFSSNHLLESERAFLYQRRSARVGQIVGRVAERNHLHEAAQFLVSDAGSKCVVIQGEAGIGKSRLADDVNDYLRELGISPFFGSGSTAEAASPYHAWRPVFRQLFQSDIPDDITSLESNILRILEAYPDLLPLAPLLSDVLSLRFPENDVTTQLQGDSRAERTREIMIRILATAASKGPVAIILDDAHWMDGSSWRFAAAVQREIHPLLLIILMRPNAEFVNEYQSMLTETPTDYLHLERMSEADIAEIVSARLGTAAPTAIDRFVCARSQGHPLFAEELSYALQESGYIEIRNGYCELRQPPGEAQTVTEVLEQLNLPRTVQATIMSRIDNLEESEQLLVKVASVIGSTFSLGLLEYVWSTNCDFAQRSLSEILRALDSMKLIHKRPTSDIDLFEFRHSIIRDVVYESVSFAHRRNLHKAVGTWYEKAQPIPISCYPLLAYHWRLAHVPSKAIDYSASAGTAALAAFSNKEAVHFFEQALRTDLEHCSPIQEDKSAKIKRAHWHLQLGMAYVNWSQYSNGSQHLEKGLHLLGFRIPSTSAGVCLGLLREILVQCKHRIRSPQLETQDLPPHTLEAVRAYEALMEVYYLGSKQVHCLYAVLRSLNLAEQVAPTVEVLRCYASTAALLGFIPVRSAARTYFDLSRKTSVEVNNVAGRAWAEMAEGVYLLGTGDWKTSVKLLRGAVVRYGELGDKRHWDDARSNLAAAHFLVGRFQESLVLTREIISSAIERNDARIHAEATRWEAHNLLVLGHRQEFNDACVRLSSLRSLVKHMGGLHREQDVYTLTSIVEFHSCNFDQSLAAVRKSLECIRYPGANFELLLENASNAETALRLWESCPELINECQSLARRACKAMRSYARIFPIGTPARWLFEGLFSWLQGHSTQAMSLWQKSYLAAEQQMMPYFGARAQYEIGRHLNRGNPLRQKHLERAGETFQKLNAASEAARVAEVQNA